MKYLIDLNENEALAAGTVGLRRHIEATLNRRKPRFSEKYAGELLGFHVLGAMAEMAVCKYFGWYWDYSVNTFHVSDIPGKKIDVRFSKNPYLNIRPDDNEINIVSVTGGFPRFEIVGWLFSEDGKRPQWKRDFNNRGVPAYFVPHDELMQPGNLLYNV